MNKASILNQANQNLKTLFPEKYTPITESDIEKVYTRNVLTVSHDSKTVKGEKKGYLTGIMYLSPSDISGIETCPQKSLGCSQACLFTAGRGRFYTVTRQRIIKTLAFYFDRDRFIATLKKSISSVLVKAKNKNLIPCIRLNGTSDIKWERITDIITSFPGIQFYDYTKQGIRFESELPPNYHLTFSLSESNLPQAKRVLEIGGNVAMVFRSANLPLVYMNHTVINGDESDLRFLDSRGVIVGLKAKGKAKKDSSGFVID